MLANLPWRFGGALAIWFMCLVFASASAAFSLDAWLERDGLIKEVTVSRATGRELLAQKIRIDRPDLQIEGEIILRTLRPLTGELNLKKAKGDLRPFFTGIVERFFGHQEISGGFIERLEIADLTLEDFSIRIMAEGYALDLVSATLADGRWEKLTGWLDHKGHWTFSSGALQLARIPLRFNPPLVPIPISYQNLQASGNLEVDVSLQLSNVSIGRLVNISDPSGFFGKVFRAMGFAQGLDSKPVFFDTFKTTVVVDGQNISTKELSLRTSTAVLTGNVIIPWQPQPRQIHLDLAVTNSKKPVQHFKSVMPWDLP